MKRGKKNSFTQHAYTFPLGGKRYEFRRHSDHNAKQIKQEYFLCLKFLCVLTGISVFTKNNMYA